ncbi:MAG: sulfotransferase family protein [Aestuariivirga sp.]
MTLRLLGAGFGRTGTSSAKLALEILGWGPCHHMHEIRDHPEQLSCWNSAAKGEPMDWDGVFKGYVSQIDWPGAAYWRQLIGHFPEAKVLLTCRDPEEWYRSLSQTIIPSATIGRVADPNPHTRAMAEMVYQTVHQQIFKGRIEDKDYAIGIYLDHIHEVQASVPANRILIYDVKAGWQPLCAFLGVPVPDKPFPHRNSTEEFRKRKSFLDGNAAHSQIKLA